MSWPMPAWERVGHIVALPVYVIALPYLCWAAAITQSSAVAFSAGWVVAFGAWSTYRMGLIPILMGWVNKADTSD